MLIDEWSNIVAGVVTHSLYTPPPVRPFPSVRCHLSRRVLSSRGTLCAAAVGAEFPKDLTNLEGDDAYGEIGGLRAASFSFPVEVKEYEAFDEDTFKEMK